MDKPLTLLFDLGGVIMDIRRENAVEALKALGFADADSYLGEYGQKGPFLGLEDGSISREEFYREVHRLMPAGVTDRQFDEAFGKFLLGIPVHRLRALEALHSRHKLYLLSNTNPIMWDGEIQREFEKDGHDINYYFDGCVASFAVKAYKPDARIFRKAEEMYGLIPGDTLFFDDSEANCKAAAALGYRTAHVKPSTEFTDYLPEDDRIFLKNAGIGDGEPRK